MITYQLQVDPAQAHGSQITNTATLVNYAGTEGGPNFVGPTPTPGIHTDDAIVNISQPDLRIVKDDNIQVTSPGETIIYDLTYDNVGTEDSHNVVISEQVSTGTTFDAANSTGTWYQADPAIPIIFPPTHSGVTCNTGTPAGTWCLYEVGEVLVGDPQVVIQYAVTVDDPLAGGITDISNTARIDDDGTEGPDADQSNNSDTDSDIVLLNLDISKTVIEINEPPLVAPIPSNSPVAIGAIVTYELEVEVPAAGVLGSISMDNVAVVDVLDQGLAFMDLVAVKLYC